MAAWSAASVCVAASALFPVTVGGRWGFADKSGQIVINPQFDRAEVFAGDLAPVRSGRWGYVDASGKLVINPQFDSAAAFSEGLAAVRLGGGPDFDPRPWSPFHGGGGRYGFIDKDGKFVINPQFDDARSFADGFAAVKMGHWGFIDKTGKIIINPQFDDAESFSEGLAVVKMGGHFGYTDTTGKLAINPQFEKAESFSEKLAAVRSGGKWGFVNPAGARFNREVKVCASVMAASSTPTDNLGSRHKHSAPAPAAIMAGRSKYWSASAVIQLVSSAPITRHASTRFSDSHSAPSATPCSSADGSPTREQASTTFSSNAATWLVGAA